MSLDILNIITVMLFTIQAAQPQSVNIPDFSTEIPLAYSCDDVLKYFGPSLDGEYCLAAKKGRQEYFVRVYCYQMDSDCPQEWLTLPAGGQKNKAETFLPSSYDQTGTKLGDVTFDKVQLDMKTMSVKLFDSVGFGSQYWTHDDENARQTQPWFYTSFMANYLCYYAPCTCDPPVTPCMGPDVVSFNFMCTLFALPTNIEIATIDSGCITSMSMDKNRQAMLTTCGIQTANDCGGCGPRVIGEKETINAKINGNRLLPLDIKPNLDPFPCTREKVGDPVASTTLFIPNSGLGSCVTNTSTIPVSCGQLPSMPVTNGRWNYKWCSVREFYYPRTCYVICDNGYTLDSGHQSVTCTKDGMIEPKLTTLANCIQLENLCDSNPCSTGSACVPSSGGYTCRCTNGKTGLHCDVDLDECASNPCLNGKCVNSLNNYQCICSVGFVGKQCEQNINECESFPCVHGTCTDGAGSYVCQCTPGYTGKQCKSNIDDCVSSQCKVGQCVDQVNGYKCVCPPGYSGLLCDVELRECSSSPCLYGKCQELKNGFQCICSPAYTGSFCDKEINECACNPCINGVCNNLYGGYECKCYTGFTGQNCELKGDMCANNLCLNGDCIDQGSNYKCSCTAGYTGRLCEQNIDECASKPCVHGFCADLVNGFQCICQCGYTAILCDRPVAQPTASGVLLTQTSACTVANCVTCIDGRSNVCSVCSTGFDNVGGTCGGVCRDANCAACTNTVDKNACSVCDAGYTLSRTNQCVHATFKRANPLAFAISSGTASNYVTRWWVFSLSITGLYVLM